MVQELSNVIEDQGSSHPPALLSSAYWLFSSWSQAGCHSHKHTVLWLREMRFSLLGAKQVVGLYKIGDRSKFGTEGIIIGSGNNIENAESKNSTEFFSLHTSPLLAPGEDDHHLL